MSQRQSILVALAIVAAALAAGAGAANANCMRSDFRFTPAFGEKIYPGTSIIMSDAAGNYDFAGLELRGPVLWSPGHIIGLRVGHPGALVAVLTPERPLEAGNIYRLAFTRSRAGLTLERPTFFPRSRWIAAGEPGPRVAQPERGPSYLALLVQVTALTVLSFAFGYAATRRIIVRRRKRIIRDLGLE